MKLIIGTRKMGKTIELLKMVNDTTITIVCADKQRTDHLLTLAVVCGYRIMKPMTINEYFASVGGYDPERRIVIDELIDCLSYLQHGANIVAATITDDSNTEIVRKGQRIENKCNNM